MAKRCLPDYNDLRRQLHVPQWARAGRPFAQWGNFAPALTPGRVFPGMYRKHDGFRLEKLAPPFQVPCSLALISSPNRESQSHSPLRPAPL